jgi:eukaryotic-like serine/threonine-protein kinase
VVGETVAERYELEELVGAGGMSSVYRAHDTLLERYVALKVLHAQYTTDDEFVERFKREARAVAQLSHPNIVTVIDRGEDGGKQFIVFEYIDGENLKELVVRKGRLSVRDALEVGLQIARGLAFAHENGVVHRDVKPQNVLLNGDGRAKVTDFGIARTLAVDGVTQTGTVMGTSNYIAPEQASGQPVGVETDVYSLGVVLYELLAGDVPFPGENFVSVAMKHVNEPPPNLLDVRNDVPLRVAAAVDRALEKDPRERFPSMDAFAAELEACLAQLDSPGDVHEGATIALGAPLPVPRSRNRHKPVSRWAIGSIVVGVLALAAVVVGLVAVHGIHGVGVNIGGGSPAKAAPIRLLGVGAWDPYGDNSEHGDLAPLATDKNPGTFWKTEDYRSFTKSGVGLVLDAGHAVKPHGITISTNTPGFTAEIQAGDNPGGGFHVVSPPQLIDGTTTITLDLQSAQRYFVVWITKLANGSGSMHVNEVTAS